MRISTAIEIKYPERRPAGERHHPGNRRLTREFGGFVAVDDVSLRVRSGTIHALIGPNGAGKTTCFNLLTAFLPPTRGTIHFKGRDITGMKPAQVARLGLVRSFQISRGVPAPDRAGERAPGAATHARRQLRFLALGKGAATSTTTGRTSCCSMSACRSMSTPWSPSCPMACKRALEIATTLALDPEMMLLDEPTAGMGARRRGPHRRVDGARAQRAAPS